MTYRERLNEEYFLWLCHLIDEDRYSDRASFKRLLTYLHDTEFTYLIANDANRAEDGIELRYRFAIQERPNESSDRILDILDKPCSIFEMMVALALRCEEIIMDDPLMGDRTGQWFWSMITNLGLGGMRDHMYDTRLVQSVINRFLEREYEPNGKGGLFYVRDAEEDLRDAEIWHQLCWYLDSIM
jgi:hypothetical protein